MPAVVIAVFKRLVFVFGGNDKIAVPDRDKVLVPIAAFSLGYPPAVAPFFSVEAVAVKFIAPDEVEFFHIQLFVADFPCKSRFFGQSKRKERKNNYQNFNKRFEH